jgi:hypothetical protein
VAKKALDLEKKMKKEGIEIVRVPIDLSAFDLWCKMHKRKPDGASRAEYVGEKTK